VPFSPDPKLHPSPLRKQGSRKGPARKLGSRFRGNDGWEISGGKNNRASCNRTFISRLCPPGHDRSCENRNLVPSAPQKKAKNATVHRQATPDRPFRNFYKPLSKQITTSAFYHNSFFLQEFFLKKGRYFLKSERKKAGASKRRPLVDPWKSGRKASRSAS